MHAGSGSRVACGHGQSPARPSLGLASWLDRAGTRQGWRGYRGQAGRSHRDEMRGWEGEGAVWDTGLARRKIRYQTGCEFLCTGCVLGSVHRRGVGLQAAMMRLGGQVDKVGDQGSSPPIRSPERFHLWFVQWWQWQPRATANVPPDVCWEFVCGLQWPRFHGVWGPGSKRGLCSGVASEPRRPGTQRNQNLVVALCSPTPRGHCRLRSGNSFITWSTTVPH